MYNIASTLYYEIDSRYSQELGVFITIGVITQPHPNFKVFNLNSRRS